MINQVYLQQTQQVTHQQNLESIISDDDPEELFELLE